jgi:hypothetical protein
VVSGAQAGVVTPLAGVTSIPTTDADARAATSGFAAGPDEDADATAAADPAVNARLQNTTIPWRVRLDKKLKRVISPPLSF